MKKTRRIAAAALAALLLLAALTGCDGSGSTKTKESKKTDPAARSAADSELWNEDAPEGGGAVHVTETSTTSGWTTYQFDADGKLTASEAYRKRGGTKERSSYTYDDQGRVSEIAVTRSGGSRRSEETTRTRYQYETRPDGGSVTSVFDENGKLLRSASCDAAGRRTELLNAGTRRIDWTYDDQGRITETWTYKIAEDGTESVSWPDSSRDEYGADENGNYSIVYTYDAATHEISGGKIYWFDADGNRKESAELVRQPDGTLAPSEDRTTFSTSVSETKYKNTGTIASRVTTFDSSDKMYREEDRTLFDKKGRPVSCVVDRKAMSKIRRKARYKGTTPEGFLNDRLESTFQTV